MDTKKIAQLTSNVIIFVLAAIIFGLIILYGYNAITKFLERSEDVAIASFENEFKQAIKAVQRDYGSVFRLELALPAKYSDVCVADSDCQRINVGNFQTIEPRIYAAWRTCSENIFLKPPTKPILIPEVVVPDGYFCLKNTGKIILRLQGLGDRAEVTPWPR